MRGKKSNLYHLVGSSVNLMNTHTSNLPLETQTKSLKLDQALSSIKFSQFIFNNTLRTPKHGIGIRNLLIFNSLRMTLYFVPRGETMKLHDHPKMSVVNFILKGKMQAKIYSKVQTKRGLYRKDVKVLEEKAMSYIDGTRTQENNLHQFTAIEETYFIDIIFPDYDENRTCTHYEEVQTQESSEIGKNLTFLRTVQNYHVDFFQI